MINNTIIFNKISGQGRLEMMLREEGQILDLELEIKTEQFKIKKKAHPKLF